MKYKTSFALCASPHTNREIKHYDTPIYKAEMISVIWSKGSHLYLSSTNRLTVFKY